MTASATVLDDADCTFVRAHGTPPLWSRSMLFGPFAPHERVFDRRANSSRKRDFFAR